MEFLYLEKHLSMLVVIWEPSPENRFASTEWHSENYSKPACFPRLWDRMIVGTLWFLWYWISLLDSSLSLYIIILFSFNCRLPRVIKEVGTLQTEWMKNEWMKWCNPDKTVYIFQTALCFYKDLCEASLKRVKVPHF